MTQARILIVEDDKLLVALLEKRLEIMGCVVTAAIPCGEDALLRITETRPDLILMDIQLEGALDGIETANRIQECFDIPIVFLTACSDNKSLERARQTNPFGYLIKPYSQQELQISIDIALYKHATEKKLREHEQWLTATLSSIGDAVISTDNSGKITFMNPAAEALSGWTFAETREHDVALTLCKHAQPASHTAGRQPELVIDISRSPLLFSRAGLPIPIEYNQAPIKNQHDTLTGTVLVLKDIRARQRAEAERRQLEARLRQSQRLEAIGILAGGIAHDFNNILGTMLGYTELLCARSQENSQELTYLEYIYQAGERAAALIRQILTFSRTHEQQRKAVTLAPLIREALKMLRATIPANILLTQQIDEHCPAVLGDATQLHQVIMNLCTNAAQSMRTSGGKLTISLRQVPYALVHRCHPELAELLYVRLTVSDTGPGIPPEIQEHIFEPFFTTKSVGEGTGLGLSVVHGIVTHHGGAISAENLPAGGSAFQVFLPTTTEREIRLFSPVENAVKQGKEHILLVEDETALAQLYKTALTEFGYQVTTAQNGEEALEYFRGMSEHIDLVFTDQTMPKMTGAQLSRALLQLDPGLPIILTTGHSETISEDEARSSGIRQFLRKPLKLSTLIQTIQRILEKERA